MLKYILLGFLNYQPLTGYDLKRLMDESTMHFWHAHHSQIYTTLRKLEDDGLLTSALEGDDERLNRRIYTLTDAGRADLRAWLGAALTEAATVKEDLLVRLFFSAPRDRAGVLSELYIQRQLHREKLAFFEHLQPGHLLEALGGGAPEHAAALAGDVPYWVATLRFGIAYQRMYLAWLEETIAALETAG